MDEKGHSEREGFSAGVKVMAGLTLLSRIFGMVRAMAITSLGAKAAVDAFVMAWRIPNLFRRLFGEGALSAAFVPVFTETAERQGEPAAARLFANTFGLMAAGLTGVLVVIEAGLLVWHLVSPGDENRQLLLGLLAVMMPFMLTVCLLALGSAALNCRKHFAFPAAAPVLLNVFVIAAAWFVSPAVAGSLPGRLYVVGVSVTAAGVVQFLLLLRLLRRLGLPTRPRLRPIEPGIRDMLRRMAPMIVGLGFLQIAELGESLVAWVFRATETASTIRLLGRELSLPLDAGVLVRLDAARYLYQLPLGVLAMSLGVAVFPLLSRYAARGDLPNLRDAFNRAVRLALMEGLATGVALLVLANPITKLIYRHGAFTAADAANAAEILRMYALGMWAYCVYPTVVRVFYAMGDNTTPLKTACVLAVPHLLMVGLGVWLPGVWLWVPKVRVCLPAPEVWVQWQAVWVPVGARAFGLATAATFSIDVLVLAWLLRRKVGRFGGRKVAKSVGRTLLACAAMAGVCLGGRWLLAGRANWIVVAVCVPAGAAAFFAVAALLRAPELGELFRRAKKETLG